MFVNYENVSLRIGAVFALASPTQPIRRWRVQRSALFLLRNGFITAQVMSRRLLNPRPRSSQHLDPLILFTAPPGRLIIKRSIGGLVGLTTMWGIGYPFGLWQPGPRDDYCALGVSDVILSARVTARHVGGILPCVSATSQSMFANCCVRHFKIYSLRITSARYFHLFARFSSQSSIPPTWRRRLLLGSMT